jgi:outer membrane protein assembly factor BamB
MKGIKEVSRHPSPGKRPQPLAYREGTLWMGSWDTDRLYAIDPQTWKVIDETPAPGKPYGLAAFADGLRVVVSIGEEDDRFFYRFVPGRGFDTASKTPCPDFTGSHLASDGATLYLTQMGFRRILAFDANGAVLREIALPTRCGGIGVRDGLFHMISADEEFENLQLATLDVRIGNPRAVPVAGLPSEARALAFDGRAWWTSHREASEIVSFEV